MFTHQPQYASSDLQLGPEVETEFATQGAGAIVEEALFVADSSKRHHDRKSELDDRTNVNRSTTGDKTIGNAQIFEDAASYQILDNNSSVDSILAEKQGDGITRYLIRGIVTMNMNRSCCRT